MSINIWTDSMQHAAVLFTNWLIQRDIILMGGTAMTCGGHKISQHPNHSGGSCR